MEKKGDTKSEKFVWIFRRVRRIAKSNSYVRHVRRSTRTEQLDSHWTDFDEIWYLRFPKICQENSSFFKIRQE